MIRNLTTGKLISRGELHCKSLWSLAMGLRFRWPQVAVLYLPETRRASIDMGFVFYAIDVLFLDAAKKVVEIKRGLRPWRVYTPSKSWSYAVEIPSLKGYKARLGDKLQF
ncbi:MAG: DUF192 domain-containing protein [Nanoarchaeota archaeon]